MTIRGKRKALSSDPAAQMASIRAANRGILPTMTVRHPAPRKLVCWLYADGSEWVGFEVEDGKLIYKAFAKKPRAGVICGDGKSHEIWSHGRWQRSMFSSPLFKRDGTWYYAGNTIIEIFDSLWGIHLTNSQLTEAQDIYRAKAK